MILADTNILLRSLNPDHQHFAMAENALIVLQLRKETLCIAPQNLVEFWAVATRPRGDNGLGMTPARAAEELASLRRFFVLLPYTADVPEVWQQLVIAQGVSGKQTHDAHLVAVMQANAVTTILTFNGKHFERFPDIRILDPVDLAAL